MTLSRWLMAFLSSLVALMLIFQAPLPDGWVRVKTKDGKYTFSMPARPNERVVQQKTQQGVEVPIPTYECNVAGCLYRLERGRSPVPIPDDRKDEFLERYTKSMGQKVKVLSREKADLGQYPGRLVQMEAQLRPAAAPCRIALWLVLVGDDLVQIRVFALNPGEEPKNVDLFFKSVGVVETETGNRR